MSHYSSLEQISLIQQTNLQTNLGLANQLLDSLEKLSLLNLSNARNQLNLQQNDGRTLLGSKNIQELVAAQTALIQPQLDQALSYSREAYVISAEAHEGLIKSIEHWHSQFNHSLASSLDSLSKTHVNSDVAVNAVKSAIFVANSAFANANKAARQVASITEASVKAVSFASTSAVETAAANQSTHKKAA